MKARFVFLALIFVVGQNVFAAESDHQALVERGAYLVRIAGCNDCHTDGYGFSNGEIPQSEWLKGDSMGWSGPWGTTYGPNLRLYMAGLTEAQWLVAARALRTRPPMPWFNLASMTDEDLTAIYHFVRSLGDTGTVGRTYLEPGVTPPPPFASFQ